MHAGPEQDPFRSPHTGHDVKIHYVLERLIIDRRLERPSTVRT